MSISFAASAFSATLIFLALLNALVLSSLWFFFPSLLSFVEWNLVSLNMLLGGTCGFLWLWHYKSASPVDGQHNHQENIAGFRLSPAVAVEVFSWLVRGAGAFLVVSAVVNLGVLAWLRLFSPTALGIVEKEPALGSLVVGTGVVVGLWAWWKRSGLDRSLSVDDAREKDGDGR